MKHLKLFFALFAMLALNVGNAWGATITIDGSASGITTTDGNQTITVDGITFKGKFKQYSTTALWFTSGSGYIYNTTSLGTINSITINYKSGGSGSSKQYFTSGNSAITSYQSGSPQITTSTGGASGTHSSFSGGFFNISISNKNLQATSIVIDYTPAGGGETPGEGGGEDPVDPTPGTGESGTIVIKYNSTFAPALPTASGSVNTTATAHTAEGLSFKEIGIYKGSSSNYLMFTQNKGFLYNTQSLGTITSVSVTYTSGTSTSGKAGVYFGTTELSTYTNTSNLTIKGQSQTDTWTNTTEGNGFFQLSTSNKNVQITQIEITYTSGGSTETAPSLTTDQFSWSATTATATLPNTFDNPPTLKNTENLAVSYSSSNEDVAKIDASGNVTLRGVGTADIKATAGDDITFKKTTVYYTLTVNKAPATPTDNVYVKVTTTAGITDGEYLIVYEDASNATPAPVAFNGDLATLDAAKNTVAVEISNSTIAGNTEIDVALFTIDVTAGTLKSASGKYIGVSSNNNGLKTEDVAKDYKNAFSVDDNGNAVIAADFEGSTMSLRYNNTAGDNNLRFRYYKNAGQQPIALYKKASEHTVTIATCDNGSVSASVANGAKVLSGTTITLSNTPATGYKLAAYDVYKTGEETTKVTVTDGKFIMPEFDVTIYATFELAKTLTGIEITNNATQTTFWQGETFNHDGLKVTAHFDGAADEDVTDKVTVNGSTDAAGTQTVEVSFTEGTVTKTTTYQITVKAIPNTKETAYTVADAYDIIDKLTTAEGVYIKGIVSQVDEYLSNYKSITYWISDDGTTTKQLQAYSGKGLDGADFANINGISVDDQVIICGDLKKHTDGTYEFNYDNYLVEHTKTTKADPELSYTTTEYDVNLGDAFTAPTLNNPHTLPVTYSSSNEDVATVATDGAVTIKAAGTVVITASFAGDDTYVTGSASYTINITDPNLLEVTFDANQDLDANNTERGEGKIIKAPITFACTDGILGSSTYGHYRIYANAKATFSAAEGYIITKVVLTSTASNDSQYGPAKLSTEDGNYTYDDKEGTWVGEAYTVTLTATAQTRATTITVYYKQDNRTDAGLAWNPAAVNLTIGDAFTAPTFTNPNSVTVSFESSNTALATVNNAGVVSLVSGKTGSATITATYAGDETYKPAEVTCIITVNPKTEDVVIVAQQDGKWYALKAEDLDGANKTMAALEVEYINGVVYNITDAAKAAITWERAVIGNQVTFKHGDMYLFGTAGGTDLKLSVDECEWTYNGKSYMIGNRTFLYRAQVFGFKNYATSNAGTADYSALPIVTAAKFENATIETRKSLIIGNYGTICYKNNITNYEGAVFYEVVGKEGHKIILDEVTELEAGVPYIYCAEAGEFKVAFGNATENEAKKQNSLQGTFTQIEDGEAGATGNTLEGNYIIYNNYIKKCGAKCGLYANRAYFIASEMESLPLPPAKAPGRRRVAMGYEGENQATGIDNITENGVITPALQGTYDIMGRQLTEPATTGFYIVNGKKVLVVK